MSPEQSARAYKKIASRVTTFKIGGYHLSFMMDRKLRLESSGRVIRTFCADLLVFAVDPYIKN
jgi:hypothetical protein